jgi:hypothetical protein
MRQILAAFGLACLLMAGGATPAVPQLALAPLEPGILDLVADDLAWQCDQGCDVEKTNSLRLEVLARSNDIDEIVQQGDVIYVHAHQPLEQSTLAYRVFDRATGVSASAPVNLWFGYRVSAQELMAVNGSEGEADADQSVEPDGQGDVIDLVQIQCPKDGHLFLQEVDGMLMVSFQPDGNFTGATYFRYASAGQTDPQSQPAIAAGAIVSPADDNLAEGMDSEEPLASPS